MPAQAPPVDPGQPRPREERRTGGRLIAGRRAGGAVSSQFIAAGGSLVLQVLAARTLGAAGYGTFAILVATLVTINAVHSGWVGDALTVLDRFDQSVRGGLQLSHLVGTAVAFVTAATVVLTLGLMAVKGAVLFALMVILWMTEELGRRIFMARREFWLLALNDTIYVTVTLAALGTCAVLLDRLTLFTFILVMAGGSLAAVTHALAQLPTHEIRTVAMSVPGLRLVSRFAVWRAAQAGLKPLVLLCVRVAVASLASRAVLGAIEAARLLLAPATSFVSGVGSYLLSHYSTSTGEGQRATRPRAVYTTMAVLVSFVLLIGAAALALLQPLTELLTSGQYSIDTGVVAGWTVYAVAFAAGIPPSLAVVARQASRDVFLLRTVDAALGLVLVFVVLTIGKAWLVPFALAVGGVTGAVLLCLRVARRAERIP